MMSLSDILPYFYQEISSLEFDRYDSFITDAKKSNLSFMHARRVTADKHPLQRQQK